MSICAFEFFHTLHSTPAHNAQLSARMRNAALTGNEQATIKPILYSEQHH